MSNLHYPLSAGLLVCGTHAFRVIHRKRHRLFLVNVLAGVERGYEVLAVKMLGRGDQDGIDRCILEEAPVVVIGSGCWH
jgi:hypothetical protein